MKWGKVPNFGEEKRKGEGRKGERMAEKEGGWKGGEKVRERVGEIETKRTKCGCRGQSEGFARVVCHTTETIMAEIAQMTPLPALGIKLAFSVGKRTQEKSLKCLF